MSKEQDAGIEKLIDDIIVDCYNEDEQLIAFETVINDAINGHAKAHHLGEPVDVVEVNSNMGVRAGLRAKITRQGKKVEVALLDLEIDSHEEEELYRFVEAYKYFVKNLG